MKQNKYLPVTGIFKGLKIPVTARGKYVLVLPGGKVRCSTNLLKLKHFVDIVGARAVILHIPKDDKTLFIFQEATA